MSRRPDSNWRPHDYETSALPAELFRHLLRGMESNHRTVLMMKSPKSAVHFLVRKHLFASCPATRRPRNIEPVAGLGPATHGLKAIGYCCTFPSQKTLIRCSTKLSYTGIYFFNVLPIFQPTFKYSWTFVFFTFLFSTPSVSQQVPYCEFFSPFCAPMA